MELSEIEATWDARAEDYDKEADHGLLDADTRRAWKDLLRTWLPSTPGVVGDFGCGTGTLSVVAAELGHEVQAFDLSAEMVERARVKTTQFGAAVHVLKADVSDPPVAPQTFDAVFSRHVLWTLPDPVASLRRWASTLRPGGRMVLVEGFWGSEDADSGDKPQLPWRTGVTAAELREAVAPLATSVRVVPLDDPVYWGKPIDHERFLLAADIAEDLPAAPPVAPALASSDLPAGHA